MARSVLPAMRGDATAATEEPRSVALLTAARDGDGRAFACLVEPHLPLLFRIAARVTRDRALAEDAVQETLALAFGRLRELQPDVALRSFLAAVAARQAHTLARSERRRSLREDAAEGPTAVPGPDDALRLAHVERALRDALCSLSEKRREALLLRLDAGLSHRELAEALHTTEGAARVLVHDAMAALKAELAAVGITLPHTPNATDDTQGTAHGRSRS